MQLIREVEVAYFRSFYKVNLSRCSDLNVIFGKNDVGKSNLVRALNLFFNQETDPSTGFSFDIDFSDQRLDEASTSEDIRKFVYVKITFNTPANYKKSLGDSFYVKRQWTVSRGEEFVEEVSSSIKPNQRHIVTRFINLISFTYIPAIKDIRIFEYLLSKIYDSISLSDEFSSSISEFAKQVQSLTSDMFSSLPIDLAFETKISAPRKMDELFETLDFETKSSEVGNVKSLTLQRGDGIKVRHIPELLRFIAEKDRHQYHIWGFEEPENSLDFISAEAEAYRIGKLAKNPKIQMFVTTHSPSFYNLEGDHVRKFYVRKNEAQTGAEIAQGRALDKIDAKTAIGEGFYLPAVAETLKEYSEQQTLMINLNAEIGALKEQISHASKPMLLTEGKTDAAILKEAWRRLRVDPCPFLIECCDTTDGVGGGAAGAGKLALCLKAVRLDSPQVVLGLFDRDAEGIKAYKSLDANFPLSTQYEGVRENRHRKSFGLLLPVPPFRSDEADAENLCMEFLFQDHVLLSKINGQGLEINYDDIIQRVGNKEVRLPGVEHPWNARITNGKKFFAEKVVPTFNDEDFSAFEEVIHRVEELYAYATA